MNTKQLIQCAQIMIIVVIFASIYLWAFHDAATQLTTKYGTTNSTDNMVQIKYGTGI